MYFGKNLQYLRRMQNKMTQETLAEKLGVSRQTVSKWELDSAYPEMDKVLELCTLFSCSMDQLFREDLGACSDAYSDIRTEKLAAFRYIPYTVISSEPEEDAKSHIRLLAEKMNIRDPRIIGWDFPFVSQEQINVYSMHGYTAALVLDAPHAACANARIQPGQSYLAITILQPFRAPFQLIPNAYKTLHTYIQTNGIRHREHADSIACFEKEYTKDGVDYMDVYIAIVD